ncbi:maltose/glucose-specific PTS transporter subunit IIBC [Facklamia miroungae]|uniref:PTS system, maltose and glucose-specific IIC component n=1 Tax=Facklamia miroungae TaxID=120956 RepID=A0A1G7UD88_9LACT|nr:maltose/glucose-specific PTS transporter subunit IIBC [Facklamia miroungae]NKZ30059.1 PTS maltose transporter subunit IICB [Facklamia miroungae]SDG45261.1 PTS system, maltose and glucose-specific IIC component [Facklamia miroungae]
MSNHNKTGRMMEFLQGLGRTFMLPVALLAFMGLLLGLGSAFTSQATIETLPFLDNNLLQVLFRFITTIGAFAFSYLPLLFAIAIPLGLAREEKGIAAFSGVVGYIIMNISINFYLGETASLANSEMMSEAGQGMILGIQSLQMGVLGGIISGIIVWRLHTKFYKTKLPDAFAFFSGTRFVPIITSLVMAIVGLILPIFWPFFASFIQGIGKVIGSAGVFGPFLFGASERLLLPFGLHHILVAMIRFTDAGGTQIINGETISGALNIFFAQLESGLQISGEATAFLSQGKMPTFMFGLPGAALAMYHTALPENRNRVKGLLISGVVATAITGITEPLEFLFLFISPLLWIFHVIMTGAGFLAMSVLGVVIGNTDGSLFDFIIFGVLQGTQTRWWMVIFVGLIWFAIYYFFFKMIILKKDLATPGRRSPRVKGTNYTTEELNYESNNLDYNVKEMIHSLGGSENINSISNCVTRLRLSVKNSENVDSQKLEDLGALGVIKLDNNNVQVIIGTHVESLRQDIEKNL